MWPGRCPWACAKMAASETHASRKGRGWSACRCRSMTDNTLKVPEPHHRGFLVVEGKQQQRQPAINASALQREHSKLSREAPLTLAGAAHGVAAPEGVCPAGQARGASPIFRLTVGAGQLPAEQVLDVLNCGRRWEEASRPVEPRGAQGSGPRSLQGLAHGLLIPVAGLQPPALCIPLTSGTARTGQCMSAGQAGPWGSLWEGPGKNSGVCLCVRGAHRRSEAMGGWPLGAGLVTQSALGQTGFGQ